MLNDEPMKKKARRKRRQDGAMAAAVDALKKRLAIAAVQRHATVRQAADSLGITTASLRHLLSRHGIRRTVKVTRTVQIKVAKP